MDSLQRLAERLRSYGPVIVKDNGDFPMACRLVDRAEPLNRGADFCTALIVTGEMHALALAGEASNCVFVIGGETPDRFSGCAASAVFLPADTDARALLADLSRVLADAAACLQARRRLEKTYFSHGDLKALVAAAEEVLDNPIAIFDIATAPVAMGERFRALGSDAALREYQEKGYISFRFSENNMFRDFLETLEKASRPFTFHYGTTPLLPRRVHKLYLNGLFVAHCSMVLVRPLREMDDDIMERLGQMVCLELERMHYDPFQNNRDSLILRELLAGAYPTEQAFYARTELYGWKPCRNFYVLNISRRRGERGMAQDSPFIPAILLREVENHMPPQTASVRYLIERQRILMLVDMKTPGVMEKAKPQLNVFLREGGHLCAVSRRFDNVLNFSRQADQTESLVQAAARAGIGSGLLDGNNQFFAHIAHVLGYTDLENYCLPELLELRAGGRAANALLRTACVYLETGRSAKETAARLAIHRNTVLRRLDRFQALTALDLEQGEDACKLLFSCRLLALAEPQNTVPDVRG